jgi:hypothetical protein
VERHESHGGLFRGPRYAIRVSRRRGRQRAEEPVFDTRRLAAALARHAELAVVAAVEPATGLVTEPGPSTHTASIVEGTNWPDQEQLAAGRTEEKGFVGVPRGTVFPVRRRRSFSETTTSSSNCCGGVDEAHQQIF